MPIVIGSVLLAGAALAAGVTIVSMTREPSAGVRSLGGCRAVGATADDATVDAVTQAARRKARRAARRRRDLRRARRDGAQHRAARADSPPTILPRRSRAASKARAASSSTSRRRASSRTSRVVESSDAQFEDSAFAPSRSGVTCRASWPASAWPRRAFTRSIRFRAQQRPDRPRCRELRADAAQRLPRDSPAFSDGPRGRAGPARRRRSARRRAAARRDAAPCTRCRIRTGRSLELLRLPVHACKATTTARSMPTRRPSPSSRARVCRRRGRWVRAREPLLRAPSVRHGAEDAAAAAARHERQLAAIGRPKPTRCSRSCARSASPKRRCRRAEPRPQITRASDAARLVDGGRGGAQIAIEQHVAAHREDAMRRPQALGDPVARRQREPRPAAARDERRDRDVQADRADPLRETATRSRRRLRRTPTTRPRSCSRSSRTSSRSRAGFGGHVQDLGVARRRRVDAFGVHDERRRGTVGEHAAPRIEPAPTDRARRERGSALRRAAP